MTRIGGAYYELIVKADRFNEGLDAARTKAASTAAAIGGSLSPAMDKTARSSAGAAVAMTGSAAAAVGLGTALGTLIKNLNRNALVDAQVLVESLDTKKTSEALAETTKRVQELQTILSASNESWWKRLANRADGQSISQTMIEIAELESFRTSLSMRAAKEREDEAANVRQEAARRAQQEQERAEAARKRTLERLDSERFQNERARISQIVDEEARIRAQAQQDILETRVDLFDETDPAIIKALEERIKLITEAQDSAIDRVQQARFESISKSVEQWEQAVTRSLEEQRRIVEQLARIADDLQRGFTAFDAGIPLARIEQTLRIMESSVRGIR